MNKIYYECPHCRDCFTAEEWNEHNNLAIITFGFDKLPEAIETENGAYDCPTCDERVDVADLTEY